MIVAFGDEMMLSLATSLVKNQILNNLGFADQDAKFRMLYRI